MNSEEDFFNHLVERAFASNKPTMGCQTDGMDTRVLVVFPVPSVFKTREQLDTLAQFVQNMVRDALDKVYGCKTWFEKEGSECMFLDDVKPNSWVWLCAWRIHGAVTSEFLAPFTRAHEFLQDVRNPDAMVSLRQAAAEKKPGPFLSKFNDYSVERLRFEYDRIKDDIRNAEAEQRYNDRILDDPDIDYDEECQLKERRGAIRQRMIQLRDDLSAVTSAIQSKMR